MNEKTETRNMALFCDFESIALGVRDAKYAGFDMQKVLERLLLKGSIVGEAETPQAGFRRDLSRLPHLRTTAGRGAGAWPADIAAGGEIRGGYIIKELSRED